MGGNLKPLRPCRHSGCSRLTRDGYCKEHAALHRQSKDRRGSTERGYTYRWQKIRKGYLAEHPWCVQCLKEGRRTPATEIDHIVPHKGDQRLFWDEENWQALCHVCHSAKTAREDGGFGRTPGS